VSTQSTEKITSPPRQDAASSDRGVSRVSQLKLRVAVMGSALAGLLAMTVIGLVSEGGFTAWWQVLSLHRLDSSPYDLLFSTIAGANAVMLALYFTVAGAVFAGLGTATASGYWSPWVFWPGLLEILSVAALAARGWGFGPFTGALVALAVIGTLALWGYLKLGEHVVETVRDRGEIQSVE
jgi:hypothetical protein